MVYCFLLSRETYRSREKVVFSVHFPRSQETLRSGEEVNSEINQEYTTLKARVNTYNKTEDVENIKIIEKKFEAHTDMLLSMKKWNLTQEEIRNPEGELKKFKDQYLKKIYAMYQDERPEDKIIDYIEVRLADLYHKVLKED